MAHDHNTIVTSSAVENNNTSALKTAVKVTSTTTPPFEIFLFPPDQDIISRKIVASGFYERDEVEFTRLIAKQQNVGGWMVDIGANLGFHSLHSAVLGMQVVCLEPSPDTAQLLRQSIQANGMTKRMHLYQAAAADTVGVGHLARHKASAGMTILVQENKQQQLPFGVEKVLDAEIKMIRVASLLHKLVAPSTNHTQPLNLLKVDAEGWELHALRGVNLGLYEFEYIVVEFFPELLWKAGNTNPVDLLRHLGDFGYDCFVHPKPAIAGNGDVVCNEAWYENEIIPQYNKDKTFHLNLFCKKTTSTTK